MSIQSINQSAKPLSISFETKRSTLCNYQLTHCVELKKLDCILKEGKLRQTKITEFAHSVLDLYNSKIKADNLSLKDLPEETRLLMEGARKVLNQEPLNQDHPFQTYFNKESKLFLALADRLHLKENHTALKVNKIWNKYSAMIVYKSDILNDREDYIMSWGQVNAPFNPDQDFLPGQELGFIHFLHSLHKPQDFYLNTEVKFDKHPITNDKIKMIYADSEEKETILKRYSDKIINNAETNSYQIAVSKTELGDYFVPLYFLPFIAS